jgi:hypothetical protein
MNPVWAQRREEVLRDCPRMVKIFEGSYLLLVMAIPAVSLSGGDTTMYSVMSHETRCPGTL